MALSLDQLNKKSEKRQLPKSMHKSKVLRPWETFDQLGSQTRTISAKEAVIRAQKIVDRNNNLVEKLKSDIVKTDLSLDNTMEFIDDRKPSTENSDHTDNENSHELEITYVNNHKDLEKIKKSIIKDDLENQSQ